MSFAASGAKVTWAPVADLQLTADIKRTARDAFGVTTRAGADARYNFTGLHLLAGAGYHQVNAFSVIQVDARTPAYSLGHSETRVWAMLEKGRLSASLDALRYHYDGSTLNPNLNGKSAMTQLVASAGIRPVENLSVSGDLTYGTNAL